MELIKAQANTTLSSDQLATLLKAAGDPLRIEILRALSTDSFGVLELCHAFDIKQSSMSHHLKVLAKAGFVTTRREGNSIFYRRNHINRNDDYFAIKNAVYNTVDRHELNAEAKRRIAELYAQRASTSKDFFSENASKFKEQQDLIAAFSVYEEQVIEVLSHTVFTQKKWALEVGPGEGELLPRLAAQFANIVALDNSPSMLEKAQQHCKQHAVKNIIFEASDTTYCKTTENRFDCIVINMVLHHTPSPSQIFIDVSQALRDDGALIVCDLCSHNQDWAREACGDLWLGFDPSDLSRWANDSGLIEDQNIYFALRNGFQIQIRQFYKRN